MDSPDANLPEVPDLSRLLTIKQWHELAAKDEADGYTVAKDFVDVEIKQNSTGGTFEFILSAGTVDRDRDVISPAGLNLDHLDKNPVWLWSHDTTGDGKHVPLIGLILAREVRRRKLYVEVDYVPEHINPMGKSVREMHEWRLGRKALKDKGGAASVGFLPEEWEFNRERGGADFKRSEVLEGSDVILPSNRDALLQMRAAGVSIGPVAEWAERFRALDDEQLVVKRAHAEAIIRALDPTKGLEVFSMKPEEIETKAEKEEPAETEEKAFDPAAIGLSESPDWADVVKTASTLPLSEGDEGADAWLADQYKRRGHEAPWVRDEPAWERYSEALKEAPDAALPLLKAAGFALEAGEIGKEPAEDLGKTLATALSTAIDKLGDKLAEKLAPPPAEKAAPPAPAGPKAETALTDEQLEKLALQIAGDLFTARTGRPLETN